MPTQVGETPSSDSAGQRIVQKKPNLLEVFQLYSTADEDNNIFLISCSTCGIMLFFFLPIERKLSWKQRFSVKYI